MLSSTVQWINRNILLSATLVGACGGIIVGCGLRTFDLSHDTIRYIGVPGELFMNSLKCIVLPLIASSLISGLSQLDAKSSGKIGSRAFMYYGITLTHAVIMGIILVLVIHPGDATTRESMVKREGPKMRVSAAEKLCDILRNLFPENIMQATFQQKQTTFVNDPSSIDGVRMVTRYVQGTNVLGVIVFCMTLGIIIPMIGPAAYPLRDLFIALDTVCTKMVRIIMWIAPFGIFSLIAEKILSVDQLVETLKMLGWFMFTVIVGLGLQVFVTIPAIYYAASRKNPYHFLRGLTEAIVTAMGTSSSAATMPVTFKCLDELGVDPRVSKFVLPVGITVNMDGTALYEAIAAIFIAQMNGLEMGIGEVVTVAITATLASIGAAAVPSGGLVTLILVLSALGIPASDVGLVMAVDWILGRLRCTTNTIGDAFACGFVDSLCSPPSLPTKFEESEESAEKRENNSNGNIQHA